MTRKYQLLTDADRALYRRVLDYASRARTWVRHSVREECPVMDCRACTRGAARRVWHHLNNDLDALMRQCPEFDSEGHVRRAPVAWAIASATTAMRELSEAYRLMYEEDLPASVLLAAVFGQDADTFGQTTTQEA